ncbi:hypothetical protein I7I53_09335 [Histoplasma capsulatum var. duboisii H88]|uniref:Uncharacterized protein n=1 Tax=Ajellomyces capsulatus (strain H88) TaxID=544711 RepID=A0A8A1L8G7_AJEC8|nr:hypothetical protein I7I53_09335 [Histoplasma capsulatum var. duboisii H88]
MLQRTNGTRPFILSLLLHAPPAHSGSGNFWPIVHAMKTRGHVGCRAQTSALLPTLLSLVSSITR